MTTATTTLADFLLARIAEDEATARAASGGLDFNWGDYGINPELLVDALFFERFASPARVLAECDAKRRIVEWHQSWPVLVETPPRFDSAPGDTNQMTYRVTQQMAWLTQQEYRQRFGGEPPTAPILRLLALPYADHDDYRPEWRP